MATIKPPLRGYTYYEQKHYDLAIADLNQALKLYAKFPYAVTERARVYRKLGQKELAAQDEKKVPGLKK